MRNLWICDQIHFNFFFILLSIVPNRIKEFETHVGHFLNNNLYLFFRKKVDVDKVVEMRADVDKRKEHIKELKTKIRYNETQRVRQIKFRARKQVA